MTNNPDNKEMPAINQSNMYLENAIVNTIRTKKKPPINLSESITKISAEYVNNMDLNTDKNTMKEDLIDSGEYTNQINKLIDRVHKTIIFSEIYTNFIMTIEENYMKNNEYKEKLSKNQKDKMLAKGIIEQILLTQLEIPTEQYKKLTIIKINQRKQDEIAVTFISRNDVGYIRSKFNKLKGSKMKIKDLTPIQFNPRHNAISALAYNLRKEKEEKKRK